MPTAHGTNIPCAAVPAPTAPQPGRATYQGGRNNRPTGGQPYSIQALAPPLPGIHANGVPPAPPPGNNNRGRQPPSQTRGTIIIIIVSRASTTSLSGTPAQPVMTGSQITKSDATEVMLPPTKWRDTQSPNTESSTPSCPWLPPLNRLDGVGHRM